jgi:hypothetical protein
MRPLFALVGCAIFLATATAAAVRAGERNHPIHIRHIRYIQRSRELNKNGGRRRKRNGRDSLSNSGGRVNARKNNKKDDAVEEKTSVIVSATPIATTNNKNVKITTKNGGAIFEYEFTTFNGPVSKKDKGVTTDSIVIVDEEADAVDILTTATAAPAISTAKRTPSPTPNPKQGSTCGISSFQRRMALMLMATKASGNIYEGTAQKAAMDWLVDIDAYQVCPDDPNALQRYTLAVFYYSTFGDNWLDCSAMPNFEEGTCDSVTVGTRGNDDSPKITGNYVWLSPVNECTWAGVQCMEDTALVDRLEFERNGLAGTLPSELGHLSELKFLFAEQGSLTGTIPTELGRLSKLLALDLDYNYLTGAAIPSSLYDLWSLTQLDLNDNLLTGTIDSAIGTLKNLKFLQLGGNPIIGTIPKELGDLDLAGGGFENTLLTGTVPLCDGESSPSRLVADCAGDIPRVVCDCCTRCTETDQLAILAQNSGT